MNLGNRKCAAEVYRLSQMSDLRPVEDNHRKVEVAGWNWFMDNTSDIINEVENDRDSIIISPNNWNFSSFEISRETGLMWDHIEKQFPEEGFERDAVSLTLGGTEPLKFLSSWYISSNYRELFIQGAKTAYDILGYNMKFLETSRIEFE